LNTNFISASISALAGAAAGVLGAQSLATKASEKTELTRELRLINAANTIAFTICNSVLASKHQYIHPLHDKFASDTALVRDLIAKAKAGQGPIHINIEADLSKFPVPEEPVEALKSMLLQSNKLQGREFALFAMLEQSVNGLKSAIAQRNALCDEFALRDHTPDEFNYRYFGLKRRDGHTNRFYADTVSAIKFYSDDVTFFGSKLIDDLYEAGVKVHKALTEKYKAKVPKVSTVDFSDAKEAGLIPPDSQYDSWLRGFTKMPSA
jgi:hypothetical protein